jgi:tetratricopeptide (TPR) repeat protein
MRWVLVSALSVIVAISSTAAWADDKRDCLEGKGHDLRIKACSAVIGHNPKDAAAYYTRAVAYQFNGEVDRAISDYNKAIELNPTDAPAYDGRGRAYVSKGDYTNAVLDVTKAGELARAPKPQPKTTARAPKEVKTIARANAPAKVAKKAAPEEVPGGVWPHWVPQGRSEN